MSERVRVRVREACPANILVALLLYYVAACHLFVVCESLIISACPQNIPCDNGFCVEEALNQWQCDCEGDFTGPSCDISFETCPDGARKCYNGGVCTLNTAPNPDGTTFGYHCDCSAAFEVNGHAVAGHECEHAPTINCEHGTAASQYSFCTNGGTCVQTVLSGMSGNHHRGCRCPPAFEGEHCQFLVPTSSSPSESPSDVPTMSPSASPSSYPSASPSFRPSNAPTESSSAEPSHSPSNTPSLSQSPSVSQTSAPSTKPSASPTLSQAPSVTSGSRGKAVGLTFVALLSNALLLVI